MLLLFDIDGTLIDGSGAGGLAMNQAFARVCGVDAAGHGVPTEGRTDLEILGAMAERLGLPMDEATREHLLQAYLEALPRTLQIRDAKLLPGVRELVTALAGDARCRLALGTGNVVAGARCKLARFGLEGHFPTGGFGDDAIRRPAVIAAALSAARRHYGIAFSAERTVVIGDSPRDVEAARANGLRVLAVGTGRMGPGPVAEARPDVLFPDLTDRRRVTAWLLQ